MGITAAKLAQGGFGENDRAGFLEFFNDERVAIRVVILEQHGSKSGRHSYGVALIFNDDGDAVQGTDKAGRLKRAVEPIGLFERVGVHTDDRVDRRAIFVIGFDPIEIHLH